MQSPAIVLIMLVAFGLILLDYLVAATVVLVKLGLCLVSYTNELIQSKGRKPVGLSEWAEAFV